MLLTEAVGAPGHITGLDRAPELLDDAAGLVHAAGQSSQITLIAGTMERLPFADRSFDWAWSVDCAGYPASDLRPILHELMRVVRRGGRVALLGWSSQLLLPGYPLLEAQLNASCSSYAPLLRDQPPAAHFLRAVGAFQAAGLEDVAVHTLVGEVQAPLKPGERAALAALCAVLWATPGTATALTDWVEMERLCRLESPDCLLNRPDYYAWFTYTIVHGRSHSRPNNRT